MPGCRAPAQGGFLPPFAFRLLRAVAVRSPFGLEGFDSAGRHVTFESPDPDWVPEPERCIYWCFDGGPMPAGSPLCPAHRTVWNLDTREIVRLGPRHSSEWERRHVGQHS